MCVILFDQIILICIISSENGCEDKMYIHAFIDFSDPEFHRLVLLWLFFSRLFHRGK